MALVEVSEDTFNDTVTQEGIVLVDAWWLAIDGWPMSSMYSTFVTCPYWG